MGVSFSGVNGIQGGTLIFTCLAASNVPERLPIAVVLLPCRVSTLTAAVRAD